MWIAYSIILTSVILPFAPSGAGDDFGWMLDHLRRQHPAEGREALILSYRELIDRHASHPRMAEAMIDLAHRLEDANPQKKIFGDRREALRWYRKAAHAAPRGSKTWRSAQFAIARRIDDPAESRRILSMIVETAAGNSLVLCTVERDLTCLALRERDFDAADRHAWNAIKWLDDPARRPADEREREDTLLVMQMAACEIVHAYPLAPWPKAKRIRKVQEFARRYAYNAFMYQAAESALERIRAD